MAHQDNKTHYVGIGIESGDKKPTNKVNLEEGNLTILHEKGPDVTIEIISKQEVPDRTICLSPSGIHKSNNKCPECGNTMEFYIEMDLDNRIDSTSSYSIDYLCKDGHNFRMSLDEAIDKYGTKL